MKMMKQSFLGLLLLVACAGVASAATEQQVAADAAALNADLETLRLRVVACPDGECPDASAILAQLAVLDARLAQVKADRASLGSCGCLLIDVAINAAIIKDDTIHIVAGEWDEIG